MSLGRSDRIGPNSRLYGHRQVVVGYGIGRITSVFSVTWEIAPSAKGKDGGGDVGGLKR